jgi:glycosyltransferase involved in cell wall biosynthesis
MRVLHVIDSGGFYGAEVMLLNLAAEQMRMGYQVEIASIGEKGIEEKAIESVAQEKGIPVRKFRMRPGPNWLGAMSVLRHAVQKRFDLLHSHGYKGNILFGLLPRRVRRLPLVTTLHGWTSVRGFTKMRMYEWLDNLSLRFVDAVVLVNRGMLEHPVLKKKKRFRRWIVNNGILPVDDSPPCVMDPAIQKFCERGYTIGALARLSPEKGFSDLIDALAILLQRGKDVRLVIFGEGGERKALEEKVAGLGLDDRVRMPGFVSNAGCYLPSFDVLAMPSLTEGLPITLLEAMRAGVPIVASKVGGIPHLLEDGKSGLLVPPTDSAALADAISLLYDQPARGREMAAAAGQVFRAKYTSERMAEGYHQIYSHVLGQEILGWETC